MTNINFSALAINDLKDIKTYINEDLCDEKLVIMLLLTY